MIFSILKLLSKELNIYYKSLKKPSGLNEKPSSMLKDVALLDEEQLKTTNNIFLTLVNLSEESTMKNNPAYIRQSNDTIAYNNPPVNLNLYVLFSVCMTNYEHALIYLGHTISFFQGKYIFNKQNTVAEGIELPDDYYFILDLYSLSFEQANYLWSTLGGKQHPFVLYKIRLLQIEKANTKETRGIIKQVKIEDSVNS